ncbi:MAG: hypothetical protein HPY90_10095 [Syntrophothermus sp.]|uniref:hypothetical protein n=1 Tax=Syntrophothermus sp. TaxID=2736299 RepID=UPI00257B9188|nr:hypothetical protein [Syntrophothermus sp.]NSW83602.1 hypothetical protein [Syntrophothermus sp.]
MFKPYSVIDLDAFRLLLGTGFWLVLLVIFLVSGRTLIWCLLVAMGIGVMAADIMAQVIMLAVIITAGGYCAKNIGTMIMLGGIFAPFKRLLDMLKNCT